MTREQRRRKQRLEGVRPVTPVRPARKKRLIGPWEIGAGVGVLLIVALSVVYAGTRASSPPPTATVAAQATGTGPKIDSIGCNNMEQLAYHIHQHLDLYEDGKYVPLPGSIGIPGGEMMARCFYWIHVHQLDPGIVHVESPSYHLYHLGNLVDIWKATEQTTTPKGGAYVNRLLKTPANQIHVFYNLKPWKHGYRSVPLSDHAVITLEIGKPVIPPSPFVGWHGES